MAQFALEAHRAVRRDLRKISAKTAKEIVNEALPKIAQSPFVGIPLTGDLKGYFKFVFRSKSVSYRIIYQIDEKRKIIFVVAIGPREKFYERLFRRIS